MEQISDGQQETAAIVIYEAFVQRMGGPWDGKDSSMAAQLCWASAGEIFRRIQLPPALTAARIEGVRRGLAKAESIVMKRSGFIHISLDIIADIQAEMANLHAGVTP